MSRESSPLLQYIRMIAGTYRNDPRSDAELLRRYAETHDQLAFASLMGRHGPLVWSVCSRILGDTYDAEDAFQCTFLALSNTANKIQVRETLAGWLHQVARRTAHHSRKAVKAQRKAPEEARALKHFEMASETEQEEVYEVLHDQLAKLPEKLRVALVLHHLENKTQVEVAHILGVTEQTVRNRLARGKSILQERLSKRGLILGITALGMLLEQTSMPAALPIGLVGKTVQAATAFRNGKLTGGIAELARQVVKQTPAGAPWWKTGWMIGILTCVGGLGAGVGGIAWKAGFFGTEASGPTAALKQQTSPSSENNVPKPPPRLDAYGDPLPEHALTRVGTVRLHQSGPHVEHGNYIEYLAFFPDGKRLISHNPVSSTPVHIWDATTGKELRRFKCGGRGRLLSVSADGRNLFTAEGRPGKQYEVGTASDVYVWEGATGKLLRIYHGPRSKGSHDPYALKCLPNGKILAVECFAADGDAGMCVWDVVTGNKICQMSGYQASMNVNGYEPNLAGRAVFSPDGKLLATIKKDVHLVNIWDVATGKEIHQFAREDPVSTTGFSPDSKNLWVVTYGPSKEDPGNWYNCCETTDVYDLVAGKLVYSWSGSLGLRSPLYSPDGKTFVEGATLRDAVTGKKVRSFNFVGVRDGDLRSAIFSPDGKILAAQKGWGTIGLWETATGKELLPFEGNRTNILSVVYSSDAKALITAGARNHRQTCDVHWWETATGKEIHRSGSPISLERHSTNPAHCLGFICSPDHKLLAGIDAHGRGSLHLWDTHAEKDSAPVKVRELCRGQHPLFFSEDGKTLVTKENFIKGRRHNIIFLWEIASGKYKELSPDVPVHPSGFSSDPIALFSDGMLLSKPCWKDDNIYICDANTGKRVGVRPLDLANKKLHHGERQYLDFIAFSPDHRIVAVVLQDRSEPGKQVTTPYLCEFATGKGICQLEESGCSGLDRHSFANGMRATVPGGFAFSPDSKLCAAAVGERILVWEILTGKAICQLSGHQARVNCVGFSADGRTFSFR